MRTSEFTIAPQFCGPPQSSNGGYFCGRIAEHFSHAIAVRLKAPPPLDAKLHLEPEGDNTLITDGHNEIGLAIPAGPAPEPSPFIALPQAREISEQGRQDAAVNHPFPTCFVCGPNRDKQDGMRIFTGPNSDETLYAAHWFAEAAWASDGKTIDERYIWSALDCPSSGPAFATVLDPKSTKAYVLGTLEVHIEKAVPAEQDYVITCSLDEDTGKLYKTRVSLYDAQGQHYASGRAVWVQVPRSLFHGA